MKPLDSIKSYYRHFLLFVAAMILQLILTAALSHFSITLLPTEICVYLFAFVLVLMPGFVMLKKKTQIPLCSLGEGIFLYFLGWGACVALEIAAFLFFPESMTYFWPVKIGFSVFFVFANLVWLWFQTNFKEITRYLVAGFGSTLVSFVSYFLFTRFAFWDEMAAQVASWVLAVLFAYLANKFWVFCSKQESLKGLVKEFWDFILGRLLTSAVLEWGLFWILVNVLHFNDLLVKTITLILVVIANYIWSKLVAFKETPKQSE